MKKCEIERNKFDLINFLPRNSNTPSPTSTNTESAKITFRKQVNICWLNGRQEYNVLLVIYTIDKNNLWWQTEKQIYCALFYIFFIGYILFSAIGEVFFLFEVYTLIPYYFLLAYSLIISIYFSIPRTIIVSLLWEIFGNWTVSLLFFGCVEELFFCVFF